MALAISLGLGVLAARADGDPTNNAQVLARWVMDQQYVIPDLPSYGALRMAPAPAVTATNGAAYFRVSPYFANLAVLGLLHAQAPGALETGNRWIGWYVAHLNPQSAPDGVPFEHFYLADGTGETACPKPGDHALCRYNDATDSAAATFLSVVWAVEQSTGGHEPPAVPHLKQQTEAIAGVLLKLQRADGLCWAKADYHVKYLEDNCEVFAGLSDLAQLEREGFHDSTMADRYQHAADRVRAAILKELYDSQAKLFRIAKFEDGRTTPVDLNTWYPDAQAQFWPILFGVISPGDSRARAAVAKIDSHWNGGTKPDWAENPQQINDGWIESGPAYGAWLAGETNRVRIYVKAVERWKFSQAGASVDFAQPFNITDAGWLLQIMAATR